MGSVGDPRERQSGRPGFVLRPRPSWPPQRTPFVRGSHKKLFFLPSEPFQRRPASYNATSPGPHSHALALQQSGRVWHGCPLHTARPRYRVTRGLRGSAAGRALGRKRDQRVGEKERLGNNARDPASRERTLTAATCPR
ncbi:hypothetical protein NDU88_007462 [Pleurodeles waltl]|uniref:Uncharacterized protein n=1 Tax=Pleurodeles waltl TaxID=8319 RepID=A0AAV7QNX4_PLEWA|nr:hypothetical protein NDU88_007462 [Pleurodeles waltl]